jgi:hypothetical protein
LDAPRERFLTVDPLSAYQPLHANQWEELFGFHALRVFRPTDRKATNP